MGADDYLATILTKYRVNEAAAQAAAQIIYPVLHKWADGHLLSAEFSGSMAKGTGVSIGTDADIFLSLSSSLNVTLGRIFDSLHEAVVEASYPARRQNVSIGTTVQGHKIDLVPGRRQSQWGNDHSLYRSKAGSWTLTNVKTHIRYVTGSRRCDEIRVLKIWRALHGLEFSSFFLEMVVIESLRYARIGDLSANVWKALEFLAAEIERCRFVDPANTNNVVSDDCTGYEKQRIAIIARQSLSKGTWGEIVW